ncbi:type II secretion system F family protein [Agrococcus jejuensis]|uniref:Tight adherence protein B n=1 Tax=Agrococcus jejuensis TaxID=399736 RepID=A0A1G8E9P5_9MICO|nr:type II secretion system F family protein [Agrococcus jejuensis]SDH66648.1 tight adherence protein B [Agrococcus jejuensis]
MTAALVGAIVVAVGIAVAVLVVLQPFRVRLARSRRRPGVAEGEGALSGAADLASNLMSKAIQPRAGALAQSLDLAGIRMRPQDFALLVLFGALVIAALVVVLGGGILALPLGAGAVGIAWLVVRSRVAKRRTEFANQLGGTLQLMSSSLRAGQSLMQALASVAKEAEEPTSSELTRVVNETRVGRPVVDALEEAADRMANVDFKWATQAIAINREVGGSLSEVLEGVAATIRERGMLRRQVAALSAEGRLSAIILMILPVGVTGFVAISNPRYLAPFVEHPFGPVLIGLAVLMFVVGGLWLRKTVEIEL